MPDIILLDIMMSESDGHEVCRDLKEIILQFILLSSLSLLKPILKILLKALMLKELIAFVSPLTGIKTTSQY